jgi:hypothetical protein
VRRLLLPLLLLACAAPVAPAPPAPRPEVLLRGVTLHAFEGSALRLEARTPTLAFERTGPRAGGVRTGPLALELKTRGVKLSAASVDGDAFVGALTGTQVEVRTSAGLLLTSPRASYRRDEGPQGAAATDAGVALRHPRFELEARAGRLDLATEAAELDGVVTRLTATGTR